VAWQTPFEVVEVGPVCSVERCYRIKTDGEGYRWKDRK
jgi:hypothetical protein